MILDVEVSFLNIAKEFLDLELAALESRSRVVIWPRLSTAAWISGDRGLRYPSLWSIWVGGRSAILLPKGQGETVRLRKEIFTRFKADTGGSQALSPVILM